MIDTIFYSIAGKKTNDTINQVLTEFLSSFYIPAAEKKLLKHSLEVAENGNYPSSSYYSAFYPEKPEILYKSLAEIKTYSVKALDFYKQKYIQKSVFEACNESVSSSELMTKLSEILDIVPEVHDVESLQPKLFTQQTKFTQGVNSGIAELDEVTNGFQPATVVSVCGFVAHGKTTLTDSILFNAANEGKKVILLSLEMSPDILWAQFEARYMNQVKGISVTAQDLIFNKVPQDVLKQIKESEQDFLNQFACNLIIIDESFIDKNMMLNYKSFSAMIKSLELKLKGLDILAVDHVTQFPLMFKDCGNAIIKTLQSFTKTYEDSRGINPVTLMAVQANREGEKRARKRNGVYDLQAISDLNEVERTSTYVVFIYTSDDMKIMQETKITMPKHRLGSVITEPIVTTFNPAIITVGQSIESVEMSDDDFNTLNVVLGDDFDVFE